jgi:hypothetical protein
MTALHFQLAGIGPATAETDVALQAPALASGIDQDFAIMRARAQCFKSRGSIG